jgi:hypothetical protein
VGPRTGVDDIEEILDPTGGLKHIINITNHCSIRNNFIYVGPINRDATAIDDNISVGREACTGLGSVQLRHCQVAPI